jgi:hypothetical protein
MLAWEIARQLHAAHSTVPFEELLGTYLRTGVLYSSQETFILARPLQYKNTEVPDAWFVHLAASSKPRPDPIGQFMRVMPHPLPYVIWQRALGRPGQHLHIYPWERLASRIGLTSDRSH